MPITARIILLSVGVLLFAIIFEMVRRRRFREELSIIWLFGGIGLIIGSFADKIIDPLAHLLGVSYPPILIVLLISFIFLGILLYFSIVISTLKSRNKELCQKVALLEHSIRKIVRNE